MYLTRLAFLRGLLAGPALPSLLRGPPPTTSPPEGVIELPPPKELWLEEWLAAWREPIRSSEDAKERFFLRALALNEPVTFAYFGGSEPGRDCWVHPVLLYRVRGYREAYLTGFCATRSAIRTFRLDRVILDASPATPTAEGGAVV